ncbi:MAG: UDP binding domain-containing protein, partial [Bryobacteraceae bacterium]
LLGLAFKPQTDDLRDAPARDIAQRLLERDCRVRGHDPVAIERARAEWPDLGIVLCESLAQALEGADAAVLVTDWPEYRDADWEQLAGAMRTPILLDGRHFLDGGRMTRAGFRYLRLSG